ncbi:MAG: HAD family phosphatase [Salinibacterium sp.]|nr:MAG: HAD family phosphatase [Salinibacterium sp.]
MDLYFFDLDKTLYAYDFRHRLPALALASGVSQYRLAKSWWAGGFEMRAEAGAWPTVDEYLDEFAAVTGGRRLTLEQWTDARARAMTRIPGSVDALRRASTLGTVSLLSNNPAPLAAALPVLAPDVVEILGPNILVSFMLGARKPAAELFSRAMEHYGARPENTFLADDSAANVAGARSVGITAHHFVADDTARATDALMAAVEGFAAR